MQVFRNTEKMRTRQCGSRFELVSVMPELGGSSWGDAVAGHVEDVEEYVAAAQCAEREGIDTLLVGYAAAIPDGWIMASRILAATSSIRVLLAHRPGVMSPNAAARLAATLDAVSEGRLSLNIVSGGSPADQVRDGDFVEHDDRYRRASEYVAIMRRLWSEGAPFDHDGEFYRLTGTCLALKPKQPSGIPIFMGGASDAAKRFAVDTVHTYMSWSEPVSEARERFDEIRTRSAAAGREPPRFSMSMRLITAETEEDAWVRAHALAPGVDGVEVPLRRRREDVGRNRQMRLAEQSLIHDERLWFGITAATKGLGNTGALVGTPDQVLQSLLRYVAEAGTETLLITGPAGIYEQFPTGFVNRLKNAANGVLDSTSGRCT
jgi:alkanesulfonate monooxygenase